MQITVYSASSGQVPQTYIKAAHELGRLIALGGHTLVNGAGRTGLMGACADACLANGGKAVGVIPQFMIDQGWQHTGMTRLEVTPNMHRRKELMAEMSDACIALPGGVGTLEELLEIITWKQLGLYLKPIVVLNTGGITTPCCNSCSVPSTSNLCAASTPPSGKWPPHRPKPCSWHRLHRCGTSQCASSLPCKQAPKHLSWVNAAPIHVS